MENTTTSERPVQLNSVLLLRELKIHDFPIKDYVSNLLGNGARNSSSEIIYTDTNTTFDKGELEVITYSDLKLMCPVDKISMVTELNNNLIELIASNFKLEKGERLDDHYLCITRSDSKFAKKGILLYRRKTNIADIELLFPNIFFNTDNFEPSVVFDQEESEMKMQENELFVAENSQKIIIDWAKQIAKGIAEKSLPKPYGDVAVAVFNLLDGLFSSSGGDGINLQQVIDELKLYIDTKFEQEKVQKQLENVKGFLVWLEDKMPSLDVPFEKLGKDYLDDFTERLKVAVGPQSDSIHTVITLLSDEKYTQKRDYFDVLVLAISTYCSAVTTLINIYLLKSENEESGKENYLKTARNYATEFSSFIVGSKAKDGRAEFIKKIIDNKINDVINGANIHYVDERYTECHRYDIGPMECHEYGNAYWQFYKDAAIKKDLYRQKIRYWSTGCCSQNRHTDSEQVKAEVTREKDSFIIGFRKTYETHYEAVEEWKNAVQKIDVALKELLLDPKFA